MYPSSCCEGAAPKARCWVVSLASRMPFGASVARQGGLLPKPQPKAQTQPASNEDPF